MYLASWGQTLPRIGSLVLLYSMKVTCCLSFSEVVIPFKMQAISVFNADSVYFLNRVFACTETFILKTCTMLDKVSIQESEFQLKYVQ